MNEPGDFQISSQVERRILLIRGRRVLLDFDLAELYQVETRALNQAVSRNLERFPDDFMFHLTSAEFRDWMSQFVISNPRARMGRRRPPRAFTEQGVAMLSSVLRSDRSVRVNIEIMRAFVRLRALLSTHEDLARKLRELEARYDAQFKVVFDAIRELMQPDADPKPRIGFGRDPE